MHNPTWIETKKECELDADGEYIVKKVTLELNRKKYLGLEKKDFIDLLIRTIGIIAIFIPLLLFYLQRDAEIRKQKTLLQLDIYSKTTAELHALLNKSITYIMLPQNRAGN